MYEKQGFKKLVNIRETGRLLAMIVIAVCGFMIFMQWIIGYVPGLLVMQAILSSIGLFAYCIELGANIVYGEKIIAPSIGATICFALILFAVIMLAII